MSRFRSNVIRRAIRFVLGPGWVQKWLKRDAVRTRFAGFRNRLVVFEDVLEYQMLVCATLYPLSSVNSSLAPTSLSRLVTISIFAFA